MTDLLAVHDLVKHYARPGVFGWLGAPAAPAVDGVSLTVRAGEVVGLIGESGSGKTTLARAAIGLLSYEGGHVDLLGQPLTRHRRLRRRVQMLVQNPDASLNPGLRVRDLLHESARLHQPHRGAEDLAREMVARVGIAERLHAWPHELSGGEKRRVGIARLLVADPLLTVADEPTAGLDAALKADIMDLLLLSRTPEKGYLVISHDLPIITHTCQRVYVMYAGRLVEEVPVAVLGRGPHHPYTEALLASAGLAPAPERSARREKPAGRNAPGCPYVGPCPHALPACARSRPPLLGPTDLHRVACPVRASGGPS